MKVPKYRYIAFDGIDGSGKTTLISNLDRKLRNQGLLPVVLAEPTPLSKIRQKLSRNEKITRPEQIRLFTEDRQWHATHVIRPLLEMLGRTPQSPFVILQDRSYYSLPAYQGDDPRNFDDLLNTQRKVAPDYDLVVVLDLEVEKALQRISQRQEVKSTFEKADFLSKVRLRFQTLTENNDELTMIGADVSESEVVNRTINLIYG